ncbi:PIN domain-like protein, partial [Mycena filopes]
ILVPASESRSLLNLATLEGFENNNRGHRAFVVGVDARISAVIAALQAAGVYHPGVGGQTLVLEKLFYQLCNFSSAPLTLVFVFDGPGRPSMKRGINVVHRPLWLIDQLKTMITAFGYHFYDAPGEAEAELALLNADGRIDAIITEDSDAFVFGARVVIRTLGPSPQDIASIYSIDAIENTDTVLLDRDGLVLCALLLGGDYASGVLGIGQHIAHGLAAGGFGTELVNIFRVDSAERGKYLAGWRNKVREELRTNSSGRLGRRWPSLADNLLDTFPNPRVVDLYLNPLTSASPSYLGPMPANTWLPREPAIHDVSNLCRSLFRWNGEELLKKLSSCVWPSVAFRMLSSVS